MSTSALELKGLSHRFGAFRVVDDVHLQVAERDVFGFLGLNGAGKTTTLRLILGLIRPRAGGVFIFGQRGGRTDPRILRDVGVLFEDYAPLPYLTGRQILHMCLRIHGLRGPASRSAAGSWLERVGLASSGDTRTRNYSLGMKRRLGLACALVHSPRLVLLDEPTNGLDPQGIHELRDVVRELNRDLGTTFLISSHILGEVEKVCNRVGIIHEGRLVREGDTSTLTDGGQPVLRLCLASADSARSLFEGAEWCEGLASVPSAPDRGEPERDEARQPGAAVFEVRVSCSVARVVRELVEAGVDVFEVTPKVRTLEDVFRETVSGE